MRNSQPSSAERSPEDGLWADELQKARKGDPDALSRILAHCGPIVRARLKIQPHLQSALDADDVMQVTYTEAFLRIGRFSSDEIDDFVGWLLVSARNNLRDAVRALEALKRPNPRRRIACEADGYPRLGELLGVTTSTPSRAVAAQEIRDAVDRALDLIPTDYAEAVRLIHLEGLSAHEAAARLGQLSGAVVMRAVRGRERLREVIGSASRLLGP